MRNLMIEKGRYLNIPREQRLCNVCDEIKDKIHFLDKRIKYKQIRSLNDYRVKSTNTKNITKSILLLIYSLLIGLERKVNKVCICMQQLQCLHG